MTSSLQIVWSFMLAAFQSAAWISNLHPLLPNTTNTQSARLGSRCRPGEPDSWWGLKAQMTYLKDPVQKSVVDGCGGADGSVGKEEGSEGGEDGVGRGNGAVHRQVELDIGAHVV